MENIFVTSDSPTQRSVSRLVWRSTFIDAESPTAEARWNRSISEPARLDCPDAFTDFEEEQFYVQSLADRASQLQGVCRQSNLKTEKTEEAEKTEIKEGTPVSKRRHGGNISRDAFSSGHSTVASSADIADVKCFSPEGLHFTDIQNVDAGASTDASSHDGFGVSEEISSMSRGSFGHPHLCERVCTFAAAGRCVSGSDCSYCHIQHTTKQLHLDKRNRRMIKAMPYAARAALMLPIMERKAKEHDFGPSCQILLTLLASEAKLARLHDGQGTQPATKWLSRVMTAMSFHDVLRHFLSGLPDPQAPSIAEIHILIEAMRLYVASGGSA